jgi:hypothetical protein
MISSPSSTIGRKSCNQHYASGSSNSCNAGRDGGVVQIKFSHYVVLLARFLADASDCALVTGNSHTVAG